jgi:ATP-dependent protease ClpP protease subunit
MEIITNLIHESDWMKITEKFIQEESSDFENSKKDVEIDIDGVIGGSMWEEDDPKNINTKQKMKAELKVLAGLNPKNITVNINSIGGSFAHALSIHDLLANSKANVITKISGMTASAATIIAQAGNDRQMSENGLILIHRASMGVMDMLNKSKVSQIAENLEAVDNKILDIYENRSKTDRKKLEKLLDAHDGAGKWIDSKEALSMGLIDKEYTPMKMAATASIEQLKFFNLPIPNNMSNELENKSLLEQLKKFVSETFIRNTKETEPEKEVEKEEEEIKDEPKVIEVIQAEIEFPEKEKEVEVIVDTEKELMAAKLAEYEAKISKLETDNLKLSASSTKAVSTPGIEDKDEINVSEIDKQIALDLKKLRAELAEVKY